MKDFPIGILDSGVGGLTVLKEIKKLLPNESIIYIADSKNSPYGEKSSKKILELSKSLIHFLVEKKVKLVVTACNTITVSTIDSLRKTFPNVPIVGTVPVIKTCVLASKNKRIGILSTEKTAGSKYQKDLIKKFAKGFKVVNLGTNKLVSLVEKGKFGKSSLEFIKAELEKFKKENIDTLALGCTHFPFLKKEIENYFNGKVKVLDSGEAIARQVERVLLSNKIKSESKNSKYEFYTSGDLIIFKKIIRKLLKSQFKGKIEKLNKLR